MIPWLLIYGTGVLIAVLLMPMLARRYAPAKAWAWLTVMILLSWIGLILFLLLAENPLGRRRKVQYQHVLEKGNAADRLNRIPRIPIEEKFTPPGTTIIRAAEGCDALPPTMGNRAQFLADHRKILAQVIADIDQAEKHVHLIMYIFQNDHTGQAVSEALIRAARRGVCCRVLVDAFGSQDLFGEVSQRLTKAGIEVYQAMRLNPIRSRLARLDIRNHRKIVVVDGRIGYIGSWNVMNADRRSKRYGPFLDLMARLSGPSCSHLQLLFLENWELDTGQDLGQEDIWGSDEDYKENDGIMQVVPSGPLYPHQPVRDLTVELIANARERLLITTPYFVPGEPLMLELRLASHRGVQVDIVIPAKSDSRLADAASRAYCRKLLKDGINVYCHSTNLLHTKSISVDGQIAMIGSANYDLRSFQLDIESNLLLYSSDDVQSVIDIQESYLQETIPYQQRWGGRGAIRQLPDDVAKLLSPLM